MPEHVTHIHIVLALISLLAILGAPIITGWFFWQRHKESTNIQAFTAINEANAETRDRDRLTILDLIKQVKEHIQTIRDRDNEIAKLKQTIQESGQTA